MSNSSKTPVEAALLNRVIDTVSDIRLLAFLKSICNEIPEAREKAEKELFVDSSLVKDVPGQVAGTKRPVSRYEHCAQCKKEFDTTVNSSTSCRYHPDEALADGNLFDDFDGPWEVLDDDEFRETHPQNFIFGCCEGNLRDDPDGCEVDWHRPQGQETEVEKSKRTKRNIMEEDGDDTDESTSEYDSSE